MSQLRYLMQLEMPENFFVVSKEHVKLAIDEIISIAKVYDRFAKIVFFSNLVIVQTKIDYKKIHQRASYVKNSGIIVRKLPNLLSDKKLKNTVNVKMKFTCKLLNLTLNRFDPIEIEKSMGDVISKYTNSKVSLKFPDFVVYLIYLENQKFFGLSTTERSTTKRPKKTQNHPNQLDWKISRAMINLCGFKENQVICDPFCGTGTTLLEAESMGMQGIGIDSNKKMYEMSKKNLDENKFTSKVINDDFSHITKIIDQIDGIVTDIPYGKNSKIKEKPENLLRDLIQKLPKKKKFAIMCKHGFEKDIDLKDVKKYEIYRHKSLTRIILVK